MEERIITKIEKYNNNKYKIFLNDEFAFLIYKSECLRFGLKEGERISDQVYDEIVSEILPKRARLYAMNLLRKQDRTERNLRRKLAEALYSEDLTEQALNYVKEFGYLDDTRYSFNYIRLCLGKHGIAEIKHKLSEKGVSPEDIEEGFRQAREEGFLEDDSEEELIEKLIRKKYHNISELEEADKNKLFAFMYRKGFTVQNVEKVLKRILTETA
ncbi:MAG: recombination regulator RecX [Lachnospiraceae bacterium]|nr:recombination regulator RecX [Lachnospiraceae bacterium]